MKKQSGSVPARVTKKTQKEKNKKKLKSQKSKINYLQTKILLHKDEISINKEIAYLLDCTMNGLSKVISLNKLILFSTDDGDAWMIDSEDKGALCLMRGFERQPFTAFDTEDHFYVKWELRYIIDGERFLVKGDDGKVAAYFNYPVLEILERIEINQDDYS